MLLERVRLSHFHSSYFIVREKIAPRQMALFRRELPLISALLLLEGLIPAPSCVSQANCPKNQFSFTIFFILIHRAAYDLAGGGCQDRFCDLAFPISGLGGLIRRIPPCHFVSAAVCRPGEALNSATTLPSAAFQIFTSPFQEPPAICLPSGLSATANT